MATVWAARHRGTQDVHALKMLMPHLAENDSFRDMFFDEARIASRIHHPNVCATHGLVELDGILTIVMEWVDGSSLVRMLRPQTDNADARPCVALPIRHAVHILAEACAGLHAAHELTDDAGSTLSVVHRDVSPHNILLTLDGRVKVTDFGVAKALGKLHMTIAGQVKGKLSYMSPEQLVGGGVDRRSDVFALGTVLYEATTGRRPFRGRHDPEIMTALVNGDFTPPSTVLAGFPPGLEEIILRALANEPDDRYPTARELGHALTRWSLSSGPPLSARQIAVLLHERCREEIESRANGAMSIAPPPPVSVPPQAPAASDAVDVDRRSHPSPVTRGVPPAKNEISMFAGVLAVLLGVAVGLSVLFYVQKARRHRAEAVSMRTHPSATPSAAPSAPASMAVATKSASTAVLNVGDLDDPPHALPLAQAHVRLDVPDGAHLFIDGRELPAGTHTVARPDAGIVHVVVKAAGSSDAVVAVAPDSPAVIEVVLQKKKRPINPVSTVTMPPNPYD